MSEKLSIATAAGRHSVVWKNRKVTWEQMVKKCSETTRTAETVAVLIPPVFEPFKTINL